MKKQLLIVIAFTLIILNSISLQAKQSSFKVNAQDEFGGTLLMQAAHEENIQNIKWLLESGANPNILDKAGVSALHFAAKNGNIPIIKLLIKHGAKAGITDDEGFTPLMLAVSHGRTQAIKLLTRHTPKQKAKKQRIPIPSIKPISPKS